MRINFQVSEEQLEELGSLVHQRLRGRDVDLAPVKTVARLDPALPGRIADYAVIRAFVEKKEEIERMADQT